MQLWTKLHGPLSPRGLVCSMANCRTPEPRQIETIKRLIWDVRRSHEYTGHVPDEREDEGCAQQCSATANTAREKQQCISHWSLLYFSCPVFLPVVLSDAPTLPKQFAPTDLRCSIRQLYLWDKGIFGVPGFRDWREDSDVARDWNQRERERKIDDNGPGFWKIGNWKIR